jgi:clan AA aspartic protease (TIGR02281 family)
MICPKCGFEQPDDMYCAFCGVNVERYSRRQKKRRYKAGILAVLIGIAALSVASLITSSHQSKSKHPDEASQDRYAERLPQINQESQLGLESRRSISVTQDYGQAKENERPLGNSPKESYEGDHVRDDHLGVEEAGLKAPLQRDKQDGKPGSDLEGEIGTATQWFEKGRALDDDSEAEIQFYEKAIEQDPTFAPAHYCLGAIYYRQANYELADKEFANFLKYASDADRDAFDIYEYYSLADVERLFEKLEEQAPAEQGKDETPPEAEKETEPKSSEETGEEASEGVMTIVRFSSVNGHITVPVVLNGFLTAKVLVDTGAGITIISKELAGELGLEKRSANSITLKTMAMDIQAQMTRLDSIRVGDLSRDNFPVAITDLPLGQRTEFAGILGMDFLNNYKIHIDNDNQRIRLTPRTQ